MTEKSFSSKITDVVKHAEEAFEDVTCSFWESCCKHVEDAEQSYWKQDVAIEAEIEKIEFLVSSSDEATDTAMEGENSETDTADETEVLEFSM